MIQSLKKTVRTAGTNICYFMHSLLVFDPLISRIGVRGLFDGVSATLFRQMTYSMCRFWAYDEAKKFLGAGTPRKYASSDQYLTFPFQTDAGKNAPAWKLALAGSMAGGIAGVVGNPGEILMVGVLALAIITTLNGPGTRYECKAISQSPPKNDSTIRIASTAYSA